jgi:hypothetical protein
MTQETNPTLVKWTNWYNDNGIGIYQHTGGGNSSSWYKPHLNCKMRALNFPFCSVCIEASLEKIHSLVNPIINYAPIGDISDPIFPLDFSVNLMEPNPNLLETKWELNGSEFQTNVNSLQINQEDLIVGNNILTLNVIDNSPLLRVDNHNTIHINSVTWNIEFSVLGIEDIASTSNKIKIVVFPNPTTSFINIELNNELDKLYNIRLYNLNGKLIKQKKQIASKNTYLSLSDIENGIYFLEIYLENNLVFTKKVIKQ